MPATTTLNLLLDAASSNSLNLISLGISACSLAIAYSTHLKTERSKTINHRASVEKIIGDILFHLSTTTGKLESTRLRCAIINREINRLSELFPDISTTAEIIEIKEDLKSVSENPDNFAELAKLIRESLNALKEKIDDPATLVQAYAIQATVLEVTATITGEDWFILLDNLEKSIDTIKKDKKVT